MLKISTSQRVNTGSLIRMVINLYSFWVKLRKGFYSWIPWPGTTTFSKQTRLKWRVSAPPVLLCPLPNCSWAKLLSLPGLVIDATAFIKFLFSFSCAMATKRCGVSLMHLTIHSPLWKKIGRIQPWTSQALFFSKSCCLSWGHCCDPGWPLFSSF